MVWPAISRRTFRGRRVEAMRAGMMATTFMQEGKAQITPEPGDCQQRTLALQQVDGFANIGHAEVLGESRIALGNLLVHCIGDVAVGEVSRGRGAQLADVESFS